MDPKRQSDGGERVDGAGTSLLHPEDRRQADAGSSREFASGPLEGQSVGAYSGCSVHDRNHAPDAGQTQGLSAVSSAPHSGQAFLYRRLTMPIDPKEFGERLRHLRERAGMSQRQLGEKSKVGKSSVDRIERGEQEPSISGLHGLAEALDVDPRELLTGEPVVTYDIQAAVDALEKAEKSHPVIRPDKDEILWLRRLRWTLVGVEPTIELLRSFIQAKRREGI